MGCICVGSVDRVKNTAPLTGCLCQTGSVPDWTRRGQQPRRFCPNDALSSPRDHRRIDYAWRGRRPSPLGIIAQRCSGLFFVLGRSPPGWQAVRRGGKIARSGGECGSRGLCRRRFDARKKAGNPAAKEGRPQLACRNRTVKSDAERNGGAAPGRLCGESGGGAMCPGNGVVKCRVRPTE